MSKTLRRDQEIGESTSKWRGRGAQRRSERITSVAHFEPENRVKSVDKVEQIVGTIRFHLLPLLKKIQSPNLSNVSHALAQVRNSNQNELHINGINNLTNAQRLLLVDKVISLIRDETGFEYLEPSAAVDLGFSRGLFPPLAFRVNEVDSRSALERDLHASPNAATRPVFTYAGKNAFCVNAMNFNNKELLSKLNGLIGRVMRVNVGGEGSCGFTGELSKIDLARNSVSFFDVDQQRLIEIFLIGNNRMLLGKPNDYANDEAEILKFYNETFDSTKDVRITDGCVDVTAAKIQPRAKYKVYLIEDRQSGQVAQALNKGRPMITSKQPFLIKDKIQFFSPNKQIGTVDRSLVLIKCPD